MTSLEIPVIVRTKNQMTIPQQVAERHHIAPGQQLVIVAGALAGVFGTTAQNVDYVRNEREIWN